jgi:GNAT superfamily N-acetyltransferase
LPTDAFANPVWNALHSTHRHLALTAGLACKYPANVSPFAALAENTPAALRDLHSLLEPNETTYVATGITDPPPPTTAGLHTEPGPLCLQMLFPPGASLPELPLQTPIAPLTCADAPAMVALTDIAFPGFFRPRTCLMGSYYGIWDSAQRSEPPKLIAMAGERMCPFPFREVSGVCTHPDHRGQGYAALLIARVLAGQRRAHALSALHVSTANTHAIDLYLRLGFLPLREIQLHRLTRVLFTRPW